MWVVITEFEEHFQDQVEVRPIHIKLNTIIIQRREKPMEREFSSDLLSL